MRSTGSVFEMVAGLEDAGYLTRIGALPQARGSFAYPVLGTVRAGVAQQASDEEFDFSLVEELLIREPSETAVRHVRGDSTRDAGLAVWSRTRVQQHALPGLLQMAQTLGSRRFAA